MLAIWDEIARIHREGGAAALATVVGTVGSTPGKSAMKLLVGRDGRFLGSVGGGCVEAEVIERAREVLATERPQRFTVALNEHDNPETGLVCGGRIDIFIEPVVMPNVFLFGAGHVGRAVCEVGAPAGFRFVIADDRAEFVTAERFPGASERHGGEFSETIAGLEIGPEDFVLVLTRGHSQDLAVLRALAARGAQPRHLGLIGSKSKWKTLREHLAAEGIGPAFLESVHTPIGLAIGAVSAHEIAVSVVAELIRLRRLGSDENGARSSPS